MIKVEFDRTVGKFVGSVNGTVIVRTISEDNAWEKCRMVEDKLNTVAKKANEKISKFSINKRFKFVEQLVQMVANDIQPSAVITGQGGLGKTFTVMKTLEACGLKNISDLASFEEGEVISKLRSFIMVKGFSTAKGLYRTLFENNNSVIVFDDCDSVLKDAVATNILKSALDSYGKRIIFWNADMKDDDLPRSFRFEGRVIFISNLPQMSIDQAIRSRSIMIDLSMTLDQKIERMEYIMQQPEFLPEYELEVKRDSIELIKTQKEKAREISLRTLISVCKIRSACTENWEEMAEYVMVNN